MSERLIILGASVRAAALSAERGGFKPYSLDLFQDRDLHGPGELVERYPAGFWPALRRAPQAAWLYTGGLENYPRLIERCAAERPLLGVAPQALRRVRDPFWLQDFCRAHGVHFPPALTPGEPRPSAGRWLLKRRRSSGGLGVFRPAAGQSPVPPRGCFWQQEIEPRQDAPHDGWPAGAVFLADRAACKLICVTRQTFTSDPGGRRPFLYAGSLGPWPVVPAVRDEIQRVGELLARQAPLVGVFGLDLLVCEDEVWLVEVNPRFPASAELWERWTGRSLVAGHVAACRGDEPALAALDPSPGTTAPEPYFHGKQIVYSQAPSRPVEAAFSQALLELASAALPSAADIPREGTQIEPGQPLTTVFASGPTLQATEQRLGELAAQVDRLWCGEHP